MEDRYKLLQKSKKKDIKAYNKSKRAKPGNNPYIVVVIDEFADFMMRPALPRPKLLMKKVYDSLTLSQLKCLLFAWQMARAVGIHLVIATSAHR